MTDYDLVVFLIEPTNRFFFFFFFIYLTWHFTIKEWFYRVSTAMRSPLSIRYMNTVLSG